MSKKNKKKEPPVPQTVIPNDPPPPFIVKRGTIDKWIITCHGYGEYKDEDEIVITCDENGQISGIEDPLVEHVIAHGTPPLVAVLMKVIHQARNAATEKGFKFGPTRDDSTKKKKGIIPEDEFDEGDENEGLDSFSEGY